MDTSKVTRFEVRDCTASRNPPGQPAGWSRVRYGVSVELSLQDGGRTLKVFLTDSEIATEGEVREQMRDGLAGWLAAEAPSD